MSEETCPSCKADLQGDPIPEKNLQHYGGKTHYSRIIGIEVQGVYDGVLYWMCPDCRHSWHRWPHGTRQHKAAIRYVS